MAKNARALLTKMAELDSQPFTMNSHYITDYKAKFLTTLVDQRHPKLQSSELGETVRSTLAGLNQLGYTGVTEDDLAKLRPTDPWQTELEVMAEVRAYWQVAYKVSTDFAPGTKTAAEILSVSSITCRVSSTTNSFVLHHGCSMTPSSSRWSSARLVVPSSAPSGSPSPQPWRRSASS